VQQLPRRTHRSDQAGLCRRSGTPTRPPVSSRRPQVSRRGRSTGISPTSLRCSSPLSLTGTRPSPNGVSRLPARAGHDTVEVNLTDCLVELSGLREDMLPLELALLTDPDLAASAARSGRARPEGGLVGAAHVRGRLTWRRAVAGRVRGDVDPAQVAVVLLANPVRARTGPL